MVLMLTTHPCRDGDNLGDQSMSFSPGVDSTGFSLILTAISALGRLIPLSKGDGSELS
jgi:hypothetical protein